MMIKGFLDNCKKPKGKYGDLILRGMNFGHSFISGWAINFTDWHYAERILDVGCGGGANINRLLKKYKNAIVDGIDYSETSVNVSRRKNKVFLGKRCNVYKGDVMALPFENSVYDGVLASETIYFWPDVKKGLEEIFRVLKSDGSLVIVCELCDPEIAKFYMSNCEGMKVYRAGEIKSYMQAVGFSQVKIYKKNYWTLISGHKD